MTQLGEEAERPAGFGERRDVADPLGMGVAVFLAMAVLQRGVGLLRNFGICRFLEPESLGEWNLAFSFLLLASPLLVLGIPGTFGRYLQRYRLRGTERQFLKQTLRTAAWTAGAGLVLMGLLHSELAGVVFGRVDRRFLMLGCLAVLLLFIVQNAVLEILKALRQLRLLAIFNFAHSLLFTILTLVILAVTPWRTAGGVVAAFGAATFICLIFGLGAVMRHLWDGSTNTQPDDSPADVSLWRWLAPFALWMWLNDLLVNLFDVADRYMILHFSQGSEGHALASVGQYHSSFVLGTLIITFGEMVAGIVLPYWSRDWEQGRSEEVSRQINFALKIASLLFSAAACAMVLAAGWLFDVVLQGQYAAGYAVLPMTLAYCCWAALRAMVRNYLWLRERPGFVAAALSSGLVLNIVMNAALLPIWGLRGAVLATMFANLAALILILVFATRIGLLLERSTACMLILPFVLLAGPFPAAIAIACVVVLMATGTRLLGPTEKRQTGELFRNLAGRFRGRQRVDLRTG